MGTWLQVGKYSREQTRGRGRVETCWALCARGIHLGEFSAFTQAGGKQGSTGPRGYRAAARAGTPKDSGSPSSGGARTESLEPLGEGRSEKRV